MSVLWVIIGVLAVAGTIALALAVILACAVVSDEREWWRLLRREPPRDYGTWWR